MGRLKFSVCGIVTDKENAENSDIEKHEESATEQQDVGR